MASFRMGGKIGDLIYSLPVMRCVGGGRLYLEHGPQSEFGKGDWHQTAEALAPLLDVLPYIDDVIWCEEGPKEAYNLNAFRRSSGLWSQHLAISHCEMFGVPASELEIPWITINGIEDCSGIVMNRSGRTHGDGKFAWAAYNSDTFDEDRVFVGTKEEHSNFVKEFGDVRYSHTNSLLEVAQLINRCTLFIGNQSAPLAIAEAMGRKTLVEVGTITRGHYESPPKFGSRTAARIPKIDTIRDSEGKEYAIQIGSAAGVYAREASSDSCQMGQGDAAGEITTEIPWGG